MAVNSIWEKTSKIWLQILGSCDPAWLWHSILFICWKEWELWLQPTTWWFCCCDLGRKLPLQVGSNYCIIMGNFFTSPNLLRILKAKGIAAAKTVRINCVENAPLQPIKEMEKLERGASDVITDNACLMEGQQSGESSVYICQKNAPQESPSLYQSSKWQGWDWPASKYFPI